MHDDTLEQFYDVLQNIEFAISCVWDSQPDLLDLDVIDALDALVRKYGAEEQGRTSPALRLSERAMQVYKSAERMCEWRLARAPLNDDELASVIPEPERSSVADILTCVKRIRKSARIWNEQLGRQGYLNYIRGFFRRMSQPAALRRSFFA